MAVITADNVAVQAQGFGSLPALRQLGLMIGLAISVALGVTVAMWSQTPNYSMLYGNLSAKDLSEVTKSLNSAGIEYKLESSGGGISVPADKLNEARIKLASSGASIGSESGYGLLDKEQGLGSNSFMLKARYQRALEGELARSISQIKFVESARVHLAIPKQSAFSRKSSSPAASVVLNLYPGRSITDMETAGIVNIVASSIPGMDSDRVSVVDDKGRLLSSQGSQSDLTLSTTQFDYTRKLEERYTKRILDIISPIVGIDGVRAQVVADINFTSTEETKESYLPEQKAVRSEQLFEQSSNQPQAQGIPGALSNQAPPGGTLEAGTAEVNAAMNNSSRALRNYEIDRTISHTRQSPTTLQRISVAVIVDYRTVVGKKGEITREALSEDEILHVTALVKEAVGFNENRGDTLNVVNTQFKLPEEVEPMPELPIWEQAWVLDLAKQVIGGLVVLFIAFGILRPMLSNLSKQGEVRLNTLETLPDGTNPTEHLPAGEDRLTLTNQNPSNSQQLMDTANTMVKEDPKRVAQVMNTWVESDE